MMAGALPRWIGSVGLVMLLAATSVACTPVGDEPPSTVPSAAPGTPDTAAAAMPATTERMPRLSDLSAGTIIATGRFAGGAAGRIEIRANGTDRGFDVALSGMEPTPPAAASLELNALPSTASEDELAMGFSYYRYDALEQATEQTFSTPGPGYGGFETNDPSYLRTAVIWAAQPGTPIGLGSIAATADLTWDLPDMNPAFEVVSDGGPVVGARGDVALGADGSPSRYRVAPGDTPDGLAARFGVTERDLEWLNPDRDRGRLVLVDITLNLSRDTRGLRG